jgi:hypothetical protein
MAMPNKAHRMRNAVRLGAKPEANSSAEKSSTLIIKTGRRPTIGGAAEQVGPDRAHRQSQKDGEGDLRNVGSKFRGDVSEHEHQEEEIERVERPTQKARRHHMLLLTGPAGKRRYPHRATPGQNV